MTATQVQRALIKYFNTKGIQQDEDFLVRVLQRFEELKAETTPDETPEEAPDAEQ